MEGLVKIETAVGVQRWALGFVGGKDTGDVPKSCYNCPLLYINQKRCQIHGPDIVIARVVKEEDVYTPVCLYQRGGTPRAVGDDQVVYNVNVLGEKAADQTGLEWTKSPTGTNCGGFSDGAECEHFIPTDGEGIDGDCALMSEDQDEYSDAMSEHKGRSVDWDDCCDGHEGENISWREAQNLIIGGTIHVVTMRAATAEKSKSFFGAPGFHRITRRRTAKKETELMDKLIFADDLIKTFKGLVGHFQKAAALHKAKSDAHADISKVHMEHAAFHKGHADALDEGDANKATAEYHAAFHKAKGEFHKSMASLHKAQAEHCAEMADAYDVGDKAAGGAAVSAPGAAAASAAAVTNKTVETADLEKGIGTAFNAMFAKALEAVQGSDEIRKAVEAAVASRVKTELDKMLEPTNVRGALPDNEEMKKRKEELAKKGLSIVSRTGSPDLNDTRTLEENADELDPELRKAIV